MLKQERNLFVDRIKQHGVEPSAFAGVDVDDALLEARRAASGLQITLIGTPLSFRAMKYQQVYDGKNYRCEARSFDAPSEAVSDDYQDRHWRGEFNMPLGDAVECFGYWLGGVVALYLNEQQAPDLWRELEGVRSVSQHSFHDDDDTAFFTEDERAYIRSVALPKIRRYIVDTYHPDPDVLRRIDSRLSYIQEAVGRPKFDFFSLLWSAVITVASTLFLSTADGRALMQFVANAIAAMQQLLS